MNSCIQKYYFSKNLIMTKSLTERVSILCHRLLHTDNGVMLYCTCRQLEQYFQDQREEKVKTLLEKMAVEEQAAITRLIEKHSQEMLLMIQEKVLSVCCCCCWC